MDRDASAVIGLTSFWWSLSVFLGDNDTAFNLLILLLAGWLT